MWIAVHVTTGFGGLAESSLKREGFETYEPKFEDGRRLYVGYMFVEISEWAEAGVINRCVGVIHTLPVRCEKPLEIVPEFVSGLKEMIENGAFTEQRHEDHVRRFLKDELVEATTGPMKGVAGRFVGYEKGCGVVLGCLLGRGFAYRVRPEFLQPARTALAERP